MEERIFVPRQVIYQTWHSITDMDWPHQSLIHENNVGICEKYNAYTISNHVAQTELTSVSMMLCSVVLFSTHFEILCKGSILTSEENINSLVTSPRFFP